MTNLLKLYADYNCGITNQGIKDLNLKSLNIRKNLKITKIKHMIKLKDLYSEHPTDYENK